MIEENGETNKKSLLNSNPTPQGKQFRMQERMRNLPNLTKRRAKLLFDALKICEDDEKRDFVYADIHEDMHTFRNTTPLHY